MDNYLMKFSRKYFEKMLDKKIKEALSNETEKKTISIPKVIILD
jgi:hypothetical protein